MKYTDRPQRSYEHLGEFYTAVQAALAQRADRLRLLRTSRKPP